MMNGWNPWGRPGGGAPSERHIRPWQDSNSRNQNSSLQAVAPMNKQAQCAGTILPPIPTNDTQREESRRRRSQDDALSADEVASELDVTYQPDTLRTASELRTFLRGANIPVDPQTKADLEKKRQRALEQQKAIQAQLEQRKRQKEEERERRKREERHEEERIEQERLRIEEQFVKEQQKLKMKEEAEALKRIAVVEAIKTAQTTAAKLPKRANNRNQPQITEETNSHGEEITLNVLDVIEENATCLPTTLTVEKLELGEEDLFAPYISNRILTPTKYRNNCACVREFATQTDLAIPVQSQPKKVKGTEVNRKGYDAQQTSRNRRTRSKSSRKNTAAKCGRQECAPTGSPKPKRPFEVYAPSHREKSWKPGKNGQDSHNTQTRTATNREPRSRDVKTRPVPQQKEIINRHAVEEPVADAAAATESSTDEVSEDPNARPRRRQWESPCRYQRPQFYSDYPLLPDGRGVRRSRSNSVAQTAERNHMLEDGIARSSSPPVPAIRNRHTSPIKLTVQEDVFNDSGRDTLMSRQRTSESPAWPEQNTKVVAKDRSPPSRSPHAALLPWQLGALCQSRNLLQQISLIRKGLIIKERQVKDIVGELEGPPGVT